MKALILASGTGSRLAPLTDSVPKCLVSVGSVTILERQIQMLCACGVSQILITTGPFVDTVKNSVASCNVSCPVRYVHNEQFATTNYIYSMYNCKDLIDDDYLLLHGDLVFDLTLLQRLCTQLQSAVLMNKTVPLPEKDFKGLVQNGRVVRIGLDVNGPGAAFLAPLYKLNRADFGSWMHAIERFVEDGKVTCYAENAFNEMNAQFDLHPCYYEHEFCMEVDTLDDLAVVRAQLL